MEIIYEPKPLTADQLRALSQEVKQALTELYGDRLDRVILYGSYARGDFHKESDVDYLVVLRDEIVKSGTEIWYISGTMSDLSDKYGVLVLAKPAAWIKYNTSELFYYQAVRREGIPV